MRVVGAQGLPTFRRHCDGEGHGCTRCARQVFEGDKPVLVHLHGDSMTTALCFERCTRFEELYDVAVVGSKWPSEGRLASGKQTAAAIAAIDNEEHRRTLAAVTSTNHATDARIFDVMGHDQCDRHGPARRLDRRPRRRQAGCFVRARAAGQRPEHSLRRFRASAPVSARVLHRRARREPVKDLLAVFKRFFASGDDIPTGTDPCGLYRGGYDTVPRVRDVS